MIPTSTMAKRATIHSRSMPTTTRASPPESGVGLMTHQLHAGSELFWLIRARTSEDGAGLSPDRKRHRSAPPVLHQGAATAKHHSKVQPAQPDLSTKSTE